jgi:transcriptional regulator with XRE-family HTH domain
MALQSRDDLIADLQSKRFRDAFVSSRVSNTLALQIRAMREERGWSQAHLAKLLATSQNAVYRLESPQYGRYNITTLKRLASIFDVGLAVWFLPFSKLVDRVTNLATDDILVPSFDNDPVLHEREVPFIQVQSTIEAVTNNLVVSAPLLTYKVHSQLPQLGSVPEPFKETQLIYGKGQSADVRGYSESPLRRTA